MREVTIRLSEELQALVDDEVSTGDHASAEAYIQSLLADEQARRSVTLDALLDAGLASGMSDKSVEQVFEEAKLRAAGRRAAEA